VLADLVTLAVLAWVGSRLYVAARTALTRGLARARSVELVRGLRPRHFLGAVPVLAVVIAVATALVQLPVLDTGWWTALGGAGNPVIGATDRTAGTPLEWLVPTLFVSMLVVALPLLVDREERMFRAGAERRGTLANLWRGVEFGLAHAIIGIPLGVALALSIGGWYFTAVYLRTWRRTGSVAAAVTASARAHLAYNLTVLALVAAALLAGV
jgi:hypothetical protein